MKRKLPPHIVLPNGMWRFVSARSKSARKKTGPRKRRVRVVHMARRKKSYRRRSAGMGGMNKWLKIAAFSGGAALLSPHVGIAPNLAGAAGGFFAGGPIGGVVGFIAGSPIASAASGMLKMNGSASQSGGYVV